MTLEIKSDQVKSDVGQIIHGIRSMLDQLEHHVGSSRTKPVASKTGRAAKLTIVPTIASRPPELSIQDKIRLALVKESLTAKQVAKVVDEPATQVEKLMRELLQQGLLINAMGKGWDKARWHWAIHSKNPANTARRELMKQLLMERPMTHSELREAVKATDKQVQEDLVELRRREVMWKMNAEGHDNLYFLPADRAEPPPEHDARLKPKPYKKPVK